MAKPVISYIRVSTAGQGRSGLGLEAQRDAIARFAKEQGYTLAGEYVEVESAKGARTRWIAGPSWQRQSRPSAISKDRSSSPSLIAYPAM